MSSIVVVLFVVFEIQFVFTNDLLQQIEPALRYHLRCLEVIGQIPTLGHAPTNCSPTTRPRAVSGMNLIISCICTYIYIELYRKCVYFL